uniref:Leucine rich repeat containing 53 n=1 Tax=Bos indicus x Bos taurus TaxID=30522 RepID=A0A4W2F3G6_BOBOX
MPDVFTPLKQLIHLSLDKNQWNCTCALYSLAQFLRNYIKSSARTLRSAKDLSCQPSTMAAATTNSVLRLSETNCDSKAANLTLVLKDRSPLFPGQDVVLLTVLGFADISSDTFSRRYATSASALARGSLEKHLTNESWQPPMEKGDNGLQPHRQRHFITGSSSKPCEPEEHSVQRILQKHRSKYDDPCRLLTQSSPGYFQPNNSLICKYVPCDQFQDYMKEKKPNCRKHSKPKKEQIQINRAIEKFLLSENNMELSGLSTKIKKTYSPKKVSFHHPDLIEKNSLVMSSKTSSHWKEQKNESNLTNLDLKKCSNPCERNKGGKGLTDPQILKKKRTNPADFKGKSKAQNLRIKLNLSPFRKVRVHPEKSLPDLPKKLKRASLPPDKFSTASEKEARVNLEPSADFCQQSEGNNYVKFTAKRLPLKHAPKQTPYYRKNMKKPSLLSANDLSVANQSSMEGTCHPTGHIPNGDPSTLTQPTPTVAEHGHSHSSFSTEHVRGTACIVMGIPSYLPATLENIGRDVLSSHHSRGATDQGATEPTEHIEQDKLKTSELSQFSMSLGNQISRTDTYEEHTLNQKQTLKHTEQLSSHEQLGNEKTLMTKPKISHPIVESCVMDEGNDVETKLPKTETFDCSPVPQTQSKGNLTFMKTNFIPYQNRIMLPKDISTSLSTQAIWPLTNSSEKGIDSINALPRDDGAEALEIKIVGKDEKKRLDESTADSSMLIRTTQMTLNGTRDEKQQTWENGKSENHVFFDSDSVEATKDLRMMSPHETQNRLPCSEIDLKINSNMHYLKEVQNIQPDTDDNRYT